jgi:hypothetical protein
VTKCRGINRPKHRWTEAERSVLVSRYADTKTADLAAELGLRESQVYQQAKRMGLAKSAAFLASNLSGRLIYGHERGGATRFKQGQPPKNKGLRRPGWGPGRMKETQFAKGALPHNTVPVGTERVRDGYLWVKVRNDLEPARRNWMSKHQYLWERAHGPVPADHLVRFRDGNRHHLTLDNLECVSRAEHVRTKGLHSLPPELVKVHQLRGAIARQINKRQPPVRPGRGRPPKQRIAA